MAEITASMVRDLRDKTDAPMMECKKALVEAEGNSAKAEELLRVRLGGKASRAATRTAAEGVVAVHVAPDAKTGAIVEVNCETDFVAQNADFLRFVSSLAELIAKKNPADVAALSALPLETSTVEEVRKALVGRMGENMSIRRFARIEAKGRLWQYVHGGANIVEKMVEGGVQKFLNRVTLLGQAFVKNDKQSVEAMLKSQGASVARFVLYVVGEGIEKKSKDFAAEVMAQVSAARTN